MLVYIYWLCIVVLAMSLSNSEASFGGRDNLRRLAREDKNFPKDFTGGDVIRALLAAKGLDYVGGGELIKVLDPYSGGQMLKTLDRLSDGQFLNSLDNFKGGEVLAVLDRLTGGDLLNSLDSTEGVVILNALERARQNKLRHRIVGPKRALDSLNGMAFGESKRSDPLMRSLGISKREMDEIDNVGFMGFAKRSGLYGPYGRGSSLSLAKKNFDEIDRAGFGTYNKRNFDEIDRSGFEGFEKRERKE